MAPRSPSLWIAAPTASRERAVTPSFLARRELKLVHVVSTNLPVSSARISTWSARGRDAPAGCTVKDNIVGVGSSTNIQYEAVRVCGDPAEITRFIVTEFDHQSPPAAQSLAPTPRETPDRAPRLRAAGSKDQNGAQAAYPKNAPATRVKVGQGISDHDC